MAADSLLEGMELVSPICDLAAAGTWTTHIANIWGVLDSKFEMTTSTQCSTHVHMSPKSGTWSLSKLQRITKAIVYFERSIGSIMPHDRSINIWCRSNRWNTLLRSQDMATVFSWIQGVQSVPHLAFLICAFSKDSEYGQAMGKTADFSHYTFRWNLVPQSAGDKGTVVFRQPCGAVETVLWIKFAISFVQGANLYGTAWTRAFPLARATEEHRHERRSAVGDE
jgi:hypothetical protein